MKKILFPLVTLVLTFGCASSGTSIEKKAIRLVAANYPDFEKVVYMSVDTVTLGDNLQFRIESAERSIRHDEMDVESYRRLYNEFRAYGEPYASSYRKQLQKAEAALKKSQDWLSDLDSLKQATLHLADKPTAYRVCIGYNYPSNLVWIQLAHDGTFLAMSKNLEGLLLNPGEDMPGYLEMALNRE